MDSTGTWFAWSPILLGGYMLYIDIETYSEADLIKSGVYRYSEDPSFEILLLAYAYDDDPVQIIDLARGEHIPQTLLRDILRNTPKSAFNANFERVCLSRRLRGNESFLAPESWTCSAVYSRYLGLPGYLEGAARIAGVEQQKDSAGKRLITYFCRPCKPTKANGGRLRNLPEHDLEKWQQFKAYCIQDVETERSLRLYLESLQSHGVGVPDHEWALWHLDQRINDRGVRLDRNLVDCALEFNTIYQQELKGRMQEITGVDNPNSVAQLKDWLEEQTGAKITSLDKEHVGILLSKYGEIPEVKSVLGLRKELGKTSTSKYQAMDQVMSAEDNRARGLLMFYGADKTGRWAGRLIQVQNLPQNKLPDLEIARDLLKAKMYSIIELLYDSPSSVLSQLIRTAFVPSPGNIFTISDFSAIEARVIAWLAGEDWRLEVFKTHGKIYEASAARMFRVPMDEIGKGSPLRAKGKVAELALGYGGAVGALTQMGGEAMGLSVDEMQTIVNEWRAANPGIVGLWRSVEEAALRAIDTQKIIAFKHKVNFRPARGGLYIRLPSGRHLTYPGARITTGKFGNPAITYQGTYTGGYGDIETYGGKLVENIVQAIARDLLAEKMIAVEEAGHQIVMHVHDEVIIDGPPGSLDDVNDIMGAPVSWAPGLPLRGDGFETPYYKKD